MIIKLKELINTSNLLSLSRLLLVIPLWVLMDYYTSPTYRYISFSLCVVAAITDILDGYFARKFNQVTELGKLIDPLADKLAIAAIILRLYWIGALPTYYFLMIILRDILIFFGGIIVTTKIGKILPSNYIGKVTVINIGLVILFTILGFTENIIFYILYYSSILLIIVSFVVYLFRAIEAFRKKDYGTI
ncbi:MAG: CDP-alcohol phosphatidyltransferase family protein [Syntrophothermus sp.]